MNARHNLSIPIRSIVLILLAAALNMALWHTASAQTTGDEPAPTLPAGTDTPSIFTEDTVIWSNVDGDSVQALPVTVATDWVLRASQHTTITVGHNPYEIKLSPDGSRAYVVNQGDSTLSVLDTATNSLLNSVSIPGGPRRIALSPDGAYGYVTQSQDGLVAIIDLATLEKVGQIEVNEKWSSPDAIAISADGAYAYVTNSYVDTFAEGGLYIIDLTTRTQIAHVRGTDQIGALDAPRDIVIDPSDPGLVYLLAGSTWAGFLHDWGINIVDVENQMMYALINIAEEESLGDPRYLQLRGLSISPDSKVAYTLSRNRNSLFKIDLIQRKTISEVFVGNAPEDFEIDYANQRVYVALDGGSSIGIVDLASFELIGSIPVRGGAARIELAQDGASLFAYLTSFDKDIVTKVDLLAPSAMIAPLTIHVRPDSEVPKQPNDVILSADGRYAYTPHINLGTLSILDLEGGIEAGFLAVGDEPHRGLLSPDGQSLYLSDKKANQVVVVDLATLELTRTLTTDAEPIAMAIANDKLYVTCWGTDQLNIIDLNTGQISGRIRMGVDPVDIVITRDGKTAYVVNQESDSISVLNLVEHIRTATIAVGDSPRNIILSQDESRAYVPNFESGSLSILDLTTNTTIDSIAAGTGAYGVALTSNEEFAFVTAFKENAIALIDLIHNEPIGKLTTAASPSFIRRVAAQLPTTAHTDVWIDGADEIISGPKGQTVQIRYGNRGTAIAKRVRLSFANNYDNEWDIRSTPNATQVESYQTCWPFWGICFDYAETLFWDLGDLDPDSEGMISIVVAPRGSSSWSSVLPLWIKSLGPEKSADDNQRQIRVQVTTEDIPNVAVKIFLPLTNR